MVKALDQKLRRDLMRLKGQVITIALVVAAGIAAFVSMKGNFISLRTARGDYYASTRFGDVFVGLERAPEALKSDVEAIEGVALVDTRVSSAATVLLPTMTKPVNARVVSLPEVEGTGLNQIHLTEGRVPDPQRDDEVVVLHAFVEAHGLRSGDIIPAVINGKWRAFTIVGVALSPEYVMTISPGSITQDPKGFAVLWMARDPLAAAFQMEGAFNDLSLTLHRDASVDVVLGEVDRIVEPYGGLGSVPRSKQFSNFIIDGELLQLQAMSNVVPAIFLAVAAFLLNVVLSRLIHLQRPEIATLKAVGYSDFEVGLHFFKLVLAVACLGTIIGVGLGSWLGVNLTAMYTHFFKFPNLVFRLDAESVAVAVGISTFAALAGAFQAVRGAVTLPPAEAMRAAPPAVYRRSLIDQLGLARALGPVLNMITRELERRPLRTLASSLAIAASVGLLVVAGWYRDGVDALVYTQFHEVMREDVLVTFTDPRPARAIHELEQLPGVLSAEGLRSVPVRFRFGHRWRDGAVFGYANDGSLRALRDKWGRRVPLPPAGIVITETMAERLQVKAGDRVTIEIREGDRSTLEVVVAGLVDEGFGLQGHMRSDVLHHTLRQPPLVSAGLLRTNPENQAQLDEALKDLPYVASVNRRHEVLDQFRAQSGKMIRVMTVLITLFGITITVGVVYNNARIALSLRARDLASLRVLGFRQSEVSAILLGEMVIQVLLALPIGMYFGWLLMRGIASTVDPETYRLPIVITAASYGYAALVTLIATLFSALLVRRKLEQLDLIGVLKTRE